MEPGQSLLLILLGGVAVFGAVAVVVQKNPVYSALFLLPLVLAVAGLFLLLAAPFLAAMQVLLYGGAIIVVFLFVIMLLNLQPEKLTGEKEPLLRTIAFLGSLALVVLVVWASFRFQVAAKPAVARREAGAMRMTNLVVHDAATGERLIAPPGQEPRQIEVEVAGGERKRVDSGGQVQISVSGEGDFRVRIFAAGYEPFDRRLGDKDYRDSWPRYVVRSGRLAQEGEISGYRVWLTPQVAGGDFGSTQAVGQQMFKQFIVPFEVVSLLILVAVVGAALLCRKEGAPEKEADEN